MARLTIKEPSGKWFIRGVDFQSLPPTVYGALCKLLDYEETGLDPDQVDRMKDTMEQIHIGSKVQGYEIYGIYKNVCIAYNRYAKGYAVWHIDNDKYGVWGGNYYTDKQEAELKFIQLAFSDNWEISCWTDCSEQLPPEPGCNPVELEYCTEYLVLIEGAEKSSVLLYTGNGEWSDECGNLYSVESWMPMPDGR